MLYKHEYKNVDWSEFTLEDIESLIDMGIVIKIWLIDHLGYNPWK